VTRTLRIHNHYTGEKEDFAPLDPQRVTMYVCGMTVQGAPHMGHMLAFVSADLVRRVLEHFGYEVVHVQNFTDIDDKIIVKANEQGRTAREVAEENIDAFFAASDRLGIRRAHRYPKVTEHMEEIIAYIQALIDKDHAYAQGGGVYFDVRRYPPYGELSGRKIDELRTGVREGLEVDANKRDPMDFALWKPAKEGEPAWDSPWGRGRPGWHIECSAMSTKYLGPTFDLHGGGRDLIFPHHENEMAQSRAVEGDFVRYWMHNGLLTLGGQKMAKSTGHFFSVEEVLGRFDPDVVRFYLLRGHFRNQMEYSQERLQEAQAAYERMATALRTFGGLVGDDRLGADVPEGITSEDGVELTGRAAATQEAFDDALADDFNSGAGLGALFELVREANSYLSGRTAPEMDAEAVHAVHATLTGCLEVLGLFGGVGVQDEIPPEIAEMARRRDAARAERDWAQADALRFRVEDTPDGTKVRPG